MYHFTEADGEAATRCQTRNFLLGLKTESKSLRGLSPKLGVSNEPHEIPHPHGENCEQRRTFMGASDHNESRG